MVSLGAFVALVGLWVCGALLVAVVFGGSVRRGQRINDEATVDYLHDLTGIPSSDLSR